MLTPLNIVYGNIVNGSLTEPENPYDVAFTRPPQPFCVRCFPGCSVSFPGVSVAHQATM
jgi:hypothetical protein